MPSTPPISPASASPALAQPYPQPQPVFRQRKSATIISVGAASPETSPVRSTSVVPSSSSSLSSSSTMASASSAAATNADDSRESEEYEDEGAPLLGPHAKWYEGPIFVAGVKLAALFFVFTAVVVGTFWFGLPPLDEADRPLLKLPRSFADLQALNGLFQKYKQTYPLRILACGVISYLFVQTFSLPGSMYISILFGAAYGMIYGLLLSCLCDSVGSLFCYVLSSIVAPPLLTLPYYRARVETWRTKILGAPGAEVGWDGVFAFLVVLRIAPFPPHWVANFVAPHLGIHAGLFWATCFVGIAPVSVIHVTIGSGLDSMTSSSDLHILSVRNVLGLVAVAVAVLIPVGLKRVFRKDLGELGDAEEALVAATPDDAAIDVPGAVPLAYDDAGAPTRYQAVDSGLVLAGPSAGDPDLDTGVAPAKGSKGCGAKGKGRAALHAISEDDVDAPLPPAQAASSKLASEHAHTRSYGAIEPAERVAPYQQPGTAWWRFATA
ncbi:hypothetical protein Q5752_005918 [Cryptotrichosporon argae]